jgi:WD40 repeat protein
VFTACLDGRLRVWRPQDGKQVAEFKPAVPMAPFTTPELSPDGRQFLLVLDGGNGVQRYCLAGPAAPTGVRNPPLAVHSATNLVTLGKLPRGLAARHADILWADLSPDGRRIAIAPRGNPPQIVEATPPHRLVLALPPQNIVNCIRFSPDGRRIATSAADHRIRVWDTDTGLALTDWVESAEPEREVAFTTDGSAVVSSSGQVLPIAVFDGPPPVWLPALAEALANAPAARTDAAPSEPSDAIGDLRRSLASLPGGDPLVAWARQLLNPPLP